MSVTKLDQIARAIYERRNGHGCKPWSKLTKSHQEPYLDDARAAVEAMREPTDDMMQAMFEAMFIDKWNGTQAVMVGAGFDATIDSILTEGKQT